jgi:hypothetical protein
MLSALFLDSLTLGEVTSDPLQILFELRYYEMTNQIFPNRSTVQTIDNMREV